MKALEGKESNGMRKLTFAAALLAFALLVVQPAAADTTYSLGMNGLGSLMKSPVVYSGTFLYGFAPTDTWEITVDDSTWPDPADSTARFNYIWDNFFADNYQDITGGENWKGYFNSSTLPSTPQFEFNTASGVIAGDITFTILIRDWYADGILSQDEKHDSSNLSATLNINPGLGTGSFVNVCGHGSVSTGAFNFVNPPTDDSVQIFGQLQTYTCPSPVEDISWGAIKALYE